MHDSKKAVLFGLSAVLLWSTVASAFKLSLRYLEPPQLLLYSSLVSTLTLFLVLAVRGQLRLLISYPARVYLQSAAFGFMNPFLYYLVLFKAYDLLPAQEAQPLNYTWAIALALLSIPLLNQRLTLMDGVATAVSYAGVVVISTRGDLSGLHFADPLGVGLALGSTVIWALYWIYNTRDHRDPVAGLLLNFLFGLAFILVYVLLFSDPWPTDPRGIFGAAYVGVFEMGLTFVLWLTALKLTASAARIGNLIFISPFLSLVFIHFLVGEDILASTYAGLVLIVSGLILQQLGVRRRCVRHARN
ncbi:MAG: DMT family transporter [Desulfobacteraceae bacterium]|jgi:drug/metabolite transporter (DMT)-like permease